MSKFNAIRLPFHRLHLLEFWRPKADPTLHEADSLTAKIVLRKLWKQNLEPGETVLPKIEADADYAMARIREAVEESDVSLLGDLFEAAKETRELIDNGLDQDLTHRIILAYSQFYFENNPSPRPLVWVEAPNHPGGITLAPRGCWQPAEPVEPTKDQLFDRVSASLIVTRRAYDACLQKLGLSGPNGLQGGKEGPPFRKDVTKK